MELSCNTITWFTVHYSHHFSVTFSYNSINFFSLNQLCIYCKYIYSLTVQSGRISSFVNFVHKIEIDKGSDDMFTCNLCAPLMLLWNTNTTCILPVSESHKRNFTILTWWEFFFWHESVRLTQSSLPLHLLQFVTVYLNAFTFQTCMVYQGLKKS